MSFNLKGVGRPTRPNTPWARDIKHWKFNSKDGCYRPDKSFWRRSRRRSHIKRWMSKQGCAHCGITNPDVLSLDHINPKSKSFDILNSTTLTGHKFTEIIAEIRKCQVLCMNCHKIKTMRDNDYESNTVNSEWRQSDFNKYHGISGKEEL